MWMHVRKFAFAACLIPTSSCVATYCDDYRYLDFQAVPGIKVVETSVPVLGGLHDVTPFPVSYALKRDAYQIVVRIYEKDDGPAATLSVISAAPMRLEIVGASDDNGFDCLIAVEQSGGVKFGWSCKSGDAVKQHITVVVIGESGDQVAIEEFPFVVVTNGRSCVKDGL